MYCSKTEIGKRIAILRNECKLSQQELSVALHLSREVVAKWENGTRDLKIEHTIALADYFDVSADWILGRTEDRKGDVDIMAIEKQLGLSPDVQKKLQDINEMGKQYYRMKQVIDVINALLASTYVDTLCSEISEFINNIKLCAFLEKKNKDINFSTSKYITIQLDHNDLEGKIKDEKSNQINKLLDEYHSKVKSQRIHYFEAQQCILEFMKDYGNSIISGFNIDKYLAEVANRRSISDALNSLNDTFEKFMNSGLFKYFKDMDINTLEQLRDYMKEDGEKIGKHNS